MMLMADGCGCEERSRGRSTSCPREPLEGGRVADEGRSAERKRARTQRLGGDGRPEEEEDNDIRGWQGGAGRMGKAGLQCLYIGIPPFI